MAYLEINLKKESRYRITAMLRSLLILQLILAICFVIFCYNASNRVSLLLIQIHKRIIFTMYAIILVHAYSVKLHYTIGLRMTTTVLNYVYLPNTVFNYKFWMVFGTLVALNGILVGVAMKLTLNAFMQDLVTALKTGIPHYLSDPAWKRLYDSMQIELKCCGMEEMSDWHEIPWIGMEHLNDESELVQAMLGPDGKILPPVVPFSCCSSESLGACYHDPLQQANLKTVWEMEGELVMRSLHEQGCIVAVRQPLEYALYGFRCFCSLALAIQLVILVLSQLLLTSSRNAALSGDPDGPGLGWIFNTKPPVTSKLLPKAEVTNELVLKDGSSQGESTVLLLEERRRRTHKYYKRYTTSPRTKMRNH